MKSELVQNYLEHPGFRFPRPPLEVDARQLAEFSAAYSEARSLGSLLTEPSYKTLGEECHALLLEVFAHLRSQETDEHEGLFLSELLQECTRILDEELEWYGRKHDSHFVNLRGKLALANAHLMQEQRHFFGNLHQPIVAELLEIADAHVGTFRENAADGKLQREQLSINSGSTVSRIRDLLNREFGDIGVLDAVSAYAGRRIRVSGLALELSVPQATWWTNAIDGISRPPKTLYAHIDETISCPKAIVYLSDVASGNGETGCYPGAYESMGLNPLQEIIGRVVGMVGNRAGSSLRDYYAKKYHQSMSSGRFRQHFMRLPEALRFNSHIGWDVAPGSSLETMLARSERHMLGPAGTFIAFDGARLLHRGGMVTRGERLALQVVFSESTAHQRALDWAKRAFR